MSASPNTLDTAEVMLEVINTDELHDMLKGRKVGMVYEGEGVHGWVYRFIAMPATLERFVRDWWGDEQADALKLYGYF